MWLKILLVLLAALLLIALSIWFFRLPLPFHFPSPTITPTPSPISGTIEVHFLDVGQGDAILVRHDNKSMLVDGGPIGAGTTVASYLKSHGVNTIDVLVSTHPHADHIGGLLTVLEEFPVKVVYDSGIPHTTQTYENYLTLIDEKNIRYIVPQRGDNINFSPNVTVQVLSPPSGGIAGGDLNENSIVLRITHGNVSFLLASDAGFQAEESMLSSGLDLKSQVLKVGHHGSKYSSSAAFLKAVGPEYSVIEVGSNPYGHPAPETLARLEEIGSKVYRTDRDGNIVMTSDGRDIMVTPQHTATA
jgi:Predicted hydrolase (metallo-beta-lactamase superfamily)